MTKLGSLLSLGFFLLLPFQLLGCIELSSTHQPTTTDTKTATETYLKDMVIVGTHDACAYVSGGPIAICQSGTIQEQLEAGVRAFDIRLRAVGNGSNELIAYHGIANQGLEWSRDIFPVFRQFLEDNPEQFLVLTFKKEGGRIKGSMEDYHEALHIALSSSAQAPWFYHNLSKDTKASDVAGKIVALQRSGIAQPDEYALLGPWKDDATFYTPLNKGGEAVAQLYIQDDYKIEGLSADDKKYAISYAFESVVSRPKEHADLFHIFYISGSGLLCYPNRAAEILNPYTANYLYEKEYYLPGIYFIDFANSKEGEQLIGQLLKISKKQIGGVNR